MWCAVWRVVLGRLNVSQRVDAACGVAGVGEIRSQARRQDLALAHDVVHHAG